MINLKTLTLDGFLSYDKAAICLDQAGITSIQGETGSGKSTIFEAIYYLLYNKTLRKKSSLADLANKVLNNGYDISLSFNVDDKSYVIQEIRGRKKEDGLFFFENGKDIRGKTDPLTREKIKNVVKLSEEEFKNLVFLGQRQSQQFITGTSGDRAQLITDLFGLERYDQIIDKIEANQKELTSEKSQLDRMIIDICNNIEELKRTLKAQKDYKEVSQDEINIVSNEVAELEQDLRCKRYDELKQKELIGKISAVQRNIDRLKLEEQHLEELRNTLALHPELKYTYVELNRTNNKIATKQSVIEQKIAEKEREVSEITSKTNICPISNAPCTLNVPEEFKEKRLALIQKDMETLGLEFDTLIEKQQKIEKLLKKAEKMEEIKQNIAEKERLVTSLRSSILVDELPDLASTKQKVAFLTQKIEQIALQLKEKSEICSNLKTQKCLFDQNRDYNASMATMLDSKKVQLVGYKSKVSDLLNRIQYLSAAGTVFKKLKLYKLDTILERININVQSQLEKISDTLKIRFSSVKRGSKGRLLDQLNISVVNGTIELPIEMLSGGQTTQVSLAILLGVYKTAFELSDKCINLLFLDEAFGTLSDDIINETFESIVNMTKDLGFNNVKVISHRDLDARFFDHVWKVERKNGISTINLQD